MKFTAKVITGSGRGKKIGYPTINLDLNDVPEETKEGIYAGKTKVEDSEYLSAIHFGPRLFHNDPKAFEVHVIDSELSELPSEIEVELVEKLRDIRDFDSEEDLKDQISMDIAEARAILGEP